MKNKLKSYYKKLIKKLFDILYGKVFLADNIYFKKNVNIIKIKLEKKSKKIYEIYEIKKSRIYSDLSENVAVIKDNFLLPKVSVQLSKNYLKNIKNNQILNTNTRKLIQEKINGSVLSLVQGASAINNYGHWIMDIIPKLCISEKYKNLNSYDAIYLPNINTDFQIDTLKYFNINFSKIINGKKIRHIFGNNITIPQHPYWKINKHQFETVANVDRDILKEIRKKFLVNTKKIKTRKIFIDRSDSLFFHNQIENYDELCVFLNKQRFKKLKLSNLSFKDQVNYFFNADLIIGAHGAGLCNTIFCRPGTKIIELVNKVDNCNLFKNISKINSLKYFKIKSSTLPTKNRIKPDISVNMDKLKKVLKS